MHMKVAGALLSSLPAARVLCSNWLAAYQYASPSLQHAWQMLGPQQHALHTRSLWPVQFLRLQGQPFTSSSHSCSTEQQQQQQGSSKAHDQGSDSNSKSQHGSNVQQEAQQAAKGLLSKSLDMEELWFAAVGGKLKVWSAKTYPELKGREEEVVGRVQESYYETLQRAAAGHVLSNRSRNQLKQACLAAATYKVLVEAVPGSEVAAEQHIIDMMGGLYAPFMLGGLKFGSWMKRVLLRQSSISQAVDTLHTIARDMEGACHCSVQPLSCGSDSDVDDAAPQAADASQGQGASSAGTASASAAGGDGSSAAPAGGASQAGAPDTQQQHEQEDEAEAKAAAEAAAQHHSQQQWHLGAALTVDSCLYAEVLKGEGVPQLLKAFCCQHNMSWLNTYSQSGVESRLEACIAKGDGCCRITVTPSGSD